MRACRRALTAIALALPVTAWAAVPVVDGSGAGNGSSYPPSGYGTSGAYAGTGVSSTPVSAQGELFMQLQQMQEDIARLRGQLEVQQNQIQQMKQEALDRYQDLDRRIGTGAPVQQPAAPSDASQNSSLGGAPGADMSAAGAPVDQPAAASSEPADPAKEKLYYDAAFDLIKAKDFDKASQAFAAFLRKYPNSQYAGNAQYWLGEVNLAKGDLQGAGQAFAKVSQLYPKHPKVPDAMYKLADVERRLGHTDRVKPILQQVISQFPGTAAAQLAQRDLQRL